MHHHVKGYKRAYWFAAAVVLFVIVLALTC